jgi:transcription antitermination factor NusG
VAHLKPRAETRVAAILRNRGIQTFVPLIRVRRGRSRFLTEPLFRGYAFLQLDLGSEEPLIARCSPGVQYLLGRSEPTPVPRSLVDAIRLRTEDENRERGEVGFRSGDRVHVMSTSLRDVEAIFDRALNVSGRTRVFIRLLGRLVPVDVNVELLAAVRG